MDDDLLNNADINFFYYHGLLGEALDAHLNAILTMSIGCGSN